MKGRFWRSVKNEDDGGHERVAHDHGVGGKNNTRSIDRAYEKVRRRQELCLLNTPDVKIAN